MTQVSIIIPVYNAEKYLHRCLLSVLHQTMENYEVLCVDDHSSDGSLAILKEFEKQFPDKMTVIANDENFGQGISRMRAIAIAKASYIMFVDSDDYIDPDYVESYINAVQNEDYDVVVGGYLAESQQDIRVFIPEQASWCITTYSIACAKMYRRAFILDHNIDFSLSRKGEDIYFGLSLFYWDAQYKVIPYAGYHYVANEASTTHTMNHETNFEQIVSEMFTEFRKKHDLCTVEKERYNVIEYTYLANMINALAVYNHGCGIPKMREKLRYVWQDAAEQFPDYQSNPYIGIFKPKGQTSKIRFGVGLTMLLRKMHLDWLFYYIIALV